MSTGNITKTLSTAKHLNSEIHVPGDKSITHRALLLNSIADGRASIIGAGLGHDCFSTIRCLRELGVDIQISKDDEILVCGRGREALQMPAGALDCGNSGTTMRLLLGVLSGLPFPTKLTGDQSLCSRPMARLTTPLQSMGAHISGVDGTQYAPLTVEGRSLKGITYQMPVPSAQLKSSLLLAGIAANGSTIIRQPAISRNHTELMLASQGISIQNDGLELAIEGGQYASATDVNIPGDISAAAFWLVAGAIHPNANIVMRDIGINPTRIGILSVLHRMEADIEVEETKAGPEPRATLRLRSASLKATSIGGGEIPLLIDELPVIALAATQANGRTEIRDAGELRIKESDRISATALGLRALGADIHELDDGLLINGPTALTGTHVDACNDHRLAMTFGIASLIAHRNTTIYGCESVDISYPEFWEQLCRFSDSHD